ncbi:MAG: transcription termination/antitermination NusG family protein [Caldilineaceae bacterium]
MEQWYCLYTKPRGEHLVATTLSALNLPIYFPTVNTTTSNETATATALFPGYLFVRVNWQQTSVAAVRWAPGVRRIIGFGDYPLPLPDAFIDTIEEQLTVIQARGGLFVQQFQPGERVRITSGPFADLEAIFDGPTSANQRVQILLKILGRLNRVVIDARALERAANQHGQHPNQRIRRTRERATDSE